MSRRKTDVENELDVATREVVNSALSSEALRLMSVHREFFHLVDKKDCKICRSFRRTILGGLSK